MSGARLFFKSDNRFKKIIGLGVIVQLVSICFAESTVTIQSGTAIAAADFGFGSLGVPPAGPSQLNVFYDSANLKTMPSDSSGLSANGWATCSWQISSSGLAVYGSSSQGFNGAYYPNQGWLYVWGDTSFSLNFKLDRPYEYTAVTPTANFNLFSGQKGKISAGIHSLSSKTHGTGNFGLNVQLTAIPATVDFFGIGVDWSLVNDPQLENVKGNLNAIKMNQVLKTWLPGYGNGVVVDLDATASSIDNATTIATQFAQFQSTVGPNDTVMFLVASHGADGQIAIGNDGFETINATTISQYLALLPPTAQKIIIVETCDASIVGRQLANEPNTAILAATDDYGGPAYIDSDGTGLFCDAIEQEVAAGVYDVNQMIGDVKVGSYFGDLIGENLSLEDSGTGIFTGLQPGLYKNVGFGGNIAGPTLDTSLAALSASNIIITNNEFKFSVVNQYTSGALAIESSTNLTAWTQVSFTPLVGSNLNYAESTSNAPTSFYRLKTIQ